MPKTLTLDDCIKIGRESSPAAKMAKSSYSAAMLMYDAFNSDYLPQLSLNGSAPGLDRSIREQAQNDATIKFVPQSNLSSYGSVQLSQKIPLTGGDLTASSDISRYDRWGTTNDFFWSTTPFRLSFRQPIFQLNTMRWDIMLQDLQFDAAKKRYSEAMEDVAADITQKFFDLYIAQMNVENAEKNVAVNDTLYKMSLGRYNVGKIAENDLLQSELGLLNVQNELENARLDYLQALEELKIALGADKEDDFKIAPPVTFKFVHVDSKIAQREALNNRSDWVGFEIRRVNADRTVTQARSNNFFNATLTASYGLNQTSNQLPDAYKNLLEQERVNITFQMPIYQWGKGTSEIEAALAEQNSIETSVELQKKNFELEVKYQTLRFDQLQNQVALRAKADTIATRRFEVAKNRFVIGKIDLNTFFIAQNEKDMALRSYIQTLKSYWVAYYNIRRLTLYDFERNEVINHQLN